MSESELAVSTHGLHKRYGSTIALDALDLAVPRGAIFGLLGPNGAGKSTTFGLLCGWLRATSGQALLLDTPVSSIRRLRGRVSALPQDARFPSHVTVASQLAHYARLGGLDRNAAVRDVSHNLERVGLADAAQLRGSELSHGMAKRVGLAQALLGEPELVFLDEPISGLDPKIARSIKDLIASLAPAATVVISSHQLADVEEICTHGAILDHGRLVVSGGIGDLTRVGAEVAIELVTGAPAPLAQLREAFGEQAVRFESPIVRIAFDAEADMAAEITRAVAIVIEAGAQVLEVRRGTSLENAFLEATS